MPSLGRNLMSRVAVFQTTARTCAFASFSEKYQCPEPGVVRLLISPSTHTSKNSVSSTPCRRFVSSETVMARRFGGAGFDPPKSSPFCSIVQGRLYTGARSRQREPMPRSVLVGDRYDNALDCPDPCPSPP